MKWAFAFPRTCRAARVPVLVLIGYPRSYPQCRVMREGFSKMQVLLSIHSASSLRVSSCAPALVSMLSSISWQTFRHRSKESSSCRCVAFFRFMLSHHSPSEVKGDCRDFSPTNTHRGVGATLRSRLPILPQGPRSVCRPSWEGISRSRSTNLCPSPCGQR